MIKRILLFTLIPTLLFSQISNWTGKTINQLSGMVSGTTDIGSKNYWEKRAYNQIHDIVNRLDLVLYASDYTSITNAFTGLSDSSGGKLFIPKKTYLSTGDLTIHNNSVIEGEGGGSLIRLLKSSATSMRIINVEDDTNVVIANIRVLGDTTEAYASEHDHAINIHNSKNIFIMGCVIDLVGGDGIYIDSSSNVYIIGNTFTNYDHGSGSGHAGTFDYGRGGVGIVGSDNVIISSNVITGGYFAIDAETTIGDTIKDLVITNNIVKDVREGLLVQAVIATSDVYNVTISNNVLEDIYTRGIRVRGSDAGIYGQYVRNISIVGNTIDSTYSSYGISCEGAKYITVLGNTVNECGSHGLNVSDTCLYVSVVGNSFNNNDTYGFGIANSSYISAMANMVIGNTTGAIVNSGNTNYMIAFNPGDGIAYVRTDGNLYNIIENTNQARYDLANIGDGSVEHGSILKLWGVGDPISDTNREVFQISFPDSSNVVFSYDKGGTGSYRNSDWALPAAANFWQISYGGNPLLKVDGNGATTIVDSLRIGTGAQIRKTFWSVTGDSLGIISYNTIDAKLDTAWSVTK